MTTRGKLLRATGAQNFDGQVHKWKRAWVFVGDENTAVAKKRIKLLKWVQTDERAEIPKGPNFPHLIPVDKEVSEQDIPPPVKVEPDKKDEEVEVKGEVDEKSSLKNASITTGDFLDLGFNEEETEDANQTEAKSSELSDPDKTSTEQFSRDPDTTSLDDRSADSSLEETKDNQDPQL